VSLQTIIEGLIFRRGRSAISIATGGVGPATIRVRFCDFMEQQGDSVYTDDHSASTALLLEQCQWLLTSTHARAVDSAADECVVKNCWVTATCEEVFRVRPPSPIQTSPSRLYLQNMSGNPGVTTGCWIYNESGVVCADDCRFGGEAGGAVIVKNHAPMGDVRAHTPPTAVVIRNSAVSSGRGKFAVECHQVPNLLILEDNYGSTGGVWFADGGAALKRDAGSRLFVSVRRNASEIRLVVGHPPGAPTASNRTLSSLAVLAAEPPGRKEYLSTDDRMLTLDDEARTVGGKAAYDKRQSAPGSVLTQSVNGFGIYETVVTATKQGVGYTLGYMAAIVGWPGGTYTLVAEIEPRSGPLTAVLYAASVAREVALEVGKHIVSIPFEVDSAADTGASIALAVPQMAIGDSFRITAMRVFKGHVEIGTPNTTAYGVQAPTAGHWCRGDIIHNQAPSPGGAIGWVCTQAGVAGAEWKPGRVYGTGTCITESTSESAYECVGAGQSAAVWPTTDQSPNVTVDGTVVWFRRPTAKFAAFGAILP
jgi:hypothetical protein